MLAPLRESLLSLECREIQNDRKALLQVLIDFILFKKEIDEEVNLNFICTHNSRRSHLAQIWAHTAAAYYGVDEISCFSGGTEATALFPMIAETLKYQGFNIEKENNLDNPKHKLYFQEDADPIIAFSKTFDDAANPNSNFAAVMTCNHADQNCPIIHGSEKRISLTYVDPKVSDGTDRQRATYLERSIQIGSEMIYVFNKVSKLV